MDGTVEPGGELAPGESAPIEHRVRRRFGALLRRWFRANGRDLPWRNTRDPYHILVSELMLQQTQVSRVVPKYAEFLGTFPTLHDIAKARPARVTEAWAGLGYYARARNLHSLARAITFDSAGKYVLGISIQRTANTGAVSSQNFGEVGSYTGDLTGLVLRPNDFSGNGLLSDPPVSVAISRDTLRFEQKGKPLTFVKR